MVSVTDGFVSYFLPRARYHHPAIRMMTSTRIQTHMLEPLLAGSEAGIGFEGAGAGVLGAGEAAGAGDEGAGVGAAAGAAPTVTLAWLWLNPLLSK